MESGDPRTSPRSLHPHHSCSEFTAMASALSFSLPSTNLFSALIPDGFLLKCKSIHVTWLLKILQSFPLALRISSNSSERITWPGHLLPSPHHFLLSSHSDHLLVPLGGYTLAARFSRFFSLVLEWSSPLCILQATHPLTPHPVNSVMSVKS